jgi:Asp-tRNA(Asn)/Glu-tRNA(Gln) amidotransferase A subunit family amidase
MAVEASRTLGEIRARHERQMSRVLLDLLDEGAALPRSSYDAALALRDRCRALAPGLFAGADVLLTPSAVGEAPVGLSSTGDPAFNRVWTLLGLPCLSLPGAVGPSGMPVGVQLVGPAGGEGTLLGAASWIEARRLLDGR